MEKFGFTVILLWVDGWFLLWQHLDDVFVDNLNKGIEKSAEEVGLVHEASLEASRRPSEVKSGFVVLVVRFVPNVKLVVVEPGFSGRKRVVELRVVVISEVLRLIIDYQFNFQFGQYFVNFLRIKVFKLCVENMLFIELL